MKMKTNSDKCVVTPNSEDINNNENTPKTFLHPGNGSRVYTRRIDVYYQRAIFEASLTTTSIRHCAIAASHKFEIPPVIIEISISASIKAKKIFSFGVHNSIGGQI
jgi:hypothetical protein